MIHRLLTPATVEPVTLAEAKVVCAVDADLIEEDAHIEHLIRSARHYVQGDLALYGNPLRLAQESWLNGWGYWPRDSWFQLRVFPVTAVTLITYMPVGEPPVEMDVADFYLDAEQGRLHRLPDALPGGWPIVALGFAGVSVTFSAGYAPAGVPPDLKEAMLAMVAHWFENREAVVAGTEYRAEAALVPKRYDDLVKPYRVRRLG
ncbi:MAG: head-tail connector protein [Caldilinea sp.]|nr:head-tail connector protein [Caldilinea sp.]